MRDAERIQRLYKDLTAARKMSKDGQLNKRNRDLAKQASIQELSEIDDLLPMQSDRSDVLKLKQQRVRELAIRIDQIIESKQANLGESMLQGLMPSMSPMAGMETAQPSPERREETGKKKVKKLNYDEEAAPPGSKPTSSRRKRDNSRRDALQDSQPKIKTFN